jgi:hypothetical protein
LHSITCINGSNGCHSKVSLLGTLSKSKIKLTEVIVGEIIGSKTKFNIVFEFKEVKLINVITFKNSIAIVKKIMLGYGMFRTPL